MEGRDETPDGRFGLLLLIVHAAVMVEAKALDGNHQAVLISFSTA
jgi:hypothetical protein